MNVVGLDIGGANIKAVKISFKDGEVVLEKVLRTYFPVWIHGGRSIGGKLVELRHALDLEPSEYYVGACMTAELSDAFRVKSEGVRVIVESVEEAFHDSLLNFYVTTEMSLVDSRRAISNYLKVAAANWAATAWLLEKQMPSRGIINAILIDVGSTTTTIIPLVNGKVVVRGYTDPEKLTYGELVYTGVLRGNVATIVDKVPYKGFLTRVSSERFALTGDVHLVLGYIDSSSYTTETADGRGVSMREAVERLSRVPCADVDMMSVREVVEVARYIYEAQVFKVFEALMQVRTWIASMNVDLNDFTVITAGIGKHLAIEAAERAGFNKFIEVDKLVGSQVSSVLPAYASALMALDKALRGAY